MLLQAALLNSFPTIFDELLQMFTVQEVAEFVRGTLGSMPSTVHIRLLAIPWTAAYQAPPSVGFSRQEYWSGVPVVPFSSCPQSLPASESFPMSQVFA